jgi:hypothetical protein
MRCAFFYLFLSEGSLEKIKSVLSGGAATAALADLFYGLRDV